MPASAILAVDETVDQVSETEPQARQRCHTARPVAKNAEGIGHDLTPTRVSHAPRITLFFLNLIVDVLEVLALMIWRRDPKLGFRRHDGLEVALRASRAD